jgi:hypothetical protein
MSSDPKRVETLSGWNWTPAPNDSNVTSVITFFQPLRWEVSLISRNFETAHIPKLFVQRRKIHRDINKYPHKCSFEITIIGDMEYPFPYAAAGPERRPEGAPREHI